ncbi:MAG: hypothetical protein RXR07_09700 [Sulfolobaceae archaeon]
MCKLFAYSNDGKTVEDGTRRSVRSKDSVHFIKRKKESEFIRGYLRYLLIKVLKPFLSSGEK